MKGLRQFPLAVAKEALTFLAKEILVQAVQFAGEATYLKKRLQPSGKDSNEIP